MGKPPWTERANCVGINPDVFFPREDERAREDMLQASEAPAKAVCRSCEVRDECLAYALRRGEREGIWGGLAPRERRRLVRRRQERARRARKAFEALPIQHAERQSAAFASLRREVEG